ncbi:polysaccharide export protein [Halotalea alkalilenta]|uniref:Polysaccharide export protein Wza n=1 Tax=Halotalea alkalilenta TaxID=376489 RepID=A0A172YGL3_9GAMM|nr:polysaccharide export protein [Halotalea alkalilenta]ANF58408.1 polysaccharide export protein Wza [Halotalea alkalilenta]
MTGTLTRWCFCLAFIAPIAGCAFAPGGNIDYSTDSAPIDDLVDVEPITLGLVRAQATEARLTRDAFDRSIRTSREQLPVYEYRIGAGDILSVVVYDHPELTNPAGGDQSAAERGTVVHADGTIYYPYIGTIQAEGRTIQEIRSEISGRLASFISTPQIDVRVVGFNSQKFYVTGQVNQSGVQAITNVPMTVLDAIASAGGLGDDADWHEVTLTHDGQDIRLSLYDMLANGDLSQNRVLQNGDVLHVPDVGNQKVYVMGEVGSARAIPMGGTRYSLTDALAQSGGMNEASANATGIFVIRQAPEGSDKLATVYQLNAKNSAALMLGAQFMLQPTDIIYVTTTALGRWNRTISLLLPSVTSIYQVTRTGNEVDDLRNR